MFLQSVIRTVKVGVGDMAKISYHNFFRNIPISRFFVMLILLLCLSSAAKIISLLQRQILSRLQNIKRYGGYLDQSGGR